MFYLTQSQYTDTGPASPCTDPITPGAWQGSRWSANKAVVNTERPGCHCMKILQPMRKLITISALISNQQILLKTVNGHHQFSLDRWKVKQCKEIDYSNIASCVHLNCYFNEQFLWDQEWCVFWSARIEFPLLYLVPLDRRVRRRRAVHMMRAILQI